MREQEDDNVIPDQGEPVDGTIDLARELYDTLEKGYSKHMNFPRRVDISDNIKALRYINFYDESSTYKGPKRFRLCLMLEVDLNQDNPVIPNDVIVGQVKDVEDFIFKVVPEITEYSMDVINEFTFDVLTVSFYIGQNKVEMSNLNVLPSNEINVLTSKYPFRYLIEHRDTFPNTYYLENPPKFAEGYSLAAQKIVKKSLSVFKAFSKGTWRGMTYEYTNPTVHMSQKLNNYNKETRVIHPNFNVTITTQWPLLNGKVFKFSDNEDLYKQLNQFMKKRFEVFGIYFL